MRQGLESQAKEINAKAKKTGTPTINLIHHIAGDGADGVKNQISQFNSLIKQKVDLIVVQPTDNAALSGSLKKANQANIPVIAYDQYIIGGELKSFITSNNYQAGFLAGEYLASKFKDKKKVKLIVVQYPKVSSAIDRVDGFFDAFKESSKTYEVVGTYEAVEPSGGKAVGKEILKSFPKKGSFDAIFTINDGGGISVVKELKKAGRDEILHATVDGDPKSIANLKEANLTVINSAQFCAEIGRQSIRQGYKFLLGQKISKKILIPTFPITKETIDRYTGWNGKIPAPFKKPWKRNSEWSAKIESF